jgi:hypothetical protein
VSKSITVDVAAAKLRVTPQRVRVLCRERRIAGARLVGRTWLVPEEPEISPPRRGPKPSYRDREMAKNPIKLQMGDFELGMYISEDAKRLEVTKVRRGSLTKVYVGRLITILQGLHEQMI